jgi:hypothetical protein
MGRGRTTTGMVTACLISSSITDWESSEDNTSSDDELTLEMYDAIDGPSEEEVYLAGEYRFYFFYNCTLIDCWLRGV